MHAALLKGSLDVARPAWLKTAMSRPMNKQMRRGKCAEGFENSDFSALKMFFMSAEQFLKSQHDYRSRKAEFVGGCYTIMTNNSI
jgi:hypothetical protein